MLATESNIFNESGQLSLVETMLATESNIFNESGQLSLIETMLATESNIFNESVQLSLVETMLATESNIFNESGQLSLIETMLTTESNSSKSVSNEGSNLGVQVISKTLCKHHIMCVMRKNYLPQTEREVNRILRWIFGEVMNKSVSEIDHIFAPISDQNES